MRRVNIHKIRILLLATLLWMTGCGAKEPGKISGEYCDVMIESGEGYSVFGAVQTVVRGENAEFLIQVQDGYRIADVEYPDYDLEQAEVGRINGVGYMRLILHKIAYPTVVGLTVEPVCQITYYANGGERQDGGNPAEGITVCAPLSHLRPNTSIGTDLFCREGYTLIGWSRSEQGDGLIGLGSRVTKQEGMTLYAQWRPWLNADNFRYQIDAGEIIILHYEGEASEIVIPGRIQGYPVRKIAEGAFASVVCDRVILPEALRNIEEGAFSKCTAEEIILFDRIMEVSDESFSGCTGLRTIRINALQKPRYSGTYFDAFPDKMDWLIANKDNRKLVLFAGSSTRFGYDSERLAEAFRTYQIVNMGVYAYTNALPQYLLLKNYMEEGDVLLSTPEFDAIEEQFCVATEIAAEFFCMIEANYDLLTELDCRRLTGVFDSFAEFQKERKRLPEKSYEISAKNYDEDGNLITGMESYNQYGDYILPRPNQEVNRPFGIKKADYNIESFPEEVLKGLKNVYAEFAEKGVTVYFSYAPRSECALTKESTMEMRGRLHVYLSERIGVPVISPIEDSIMEGYYFYATDNHLSDQGVEIRTGQIIADLQKQMTKDREQQERSENN